MEKYIPRTPLTSCQTTGSDAAAPTLQSLPFELRHKIFCDVINYEIKDSRAPTQARNIWVPSKLHMSDRRHRSNNVLWRAGSEQSLFFVCRQFTREYHAAFFERYTFVLSFSSNFRNLVTWATRAGCAASVRSVRVWHEVGTGGDITLLKAFPGLTDLRIAISARDLTGRVWGGVASGILAYYYDQKGAQDCPCTWRLHEVLELIKCTRLSCITVDCVYKHDHLVSQVIVPEVRRLLEWFKDEVGKLGREVKVEAWVKKFMTEGGDLVGDDETEKVQN